VRGVGRVTGVAGGLPRAGRLVAGGLRRSVHGRRAGRGRRLGAGQAGQVQRQPGQAGLLQELLDQEPEHQQYGHLADDERLGRLHADHGHHDGHEHLELHLHQHHERHEHFVLHHAHFHVGYKR